MNIWRYKQFNKILISDFATDFWVHPPHNHNHFEFIFIKEGNGIHLLNGEKFAYNTNDLFLLGPEDYHEFIIENSTHFSYIKFTDAVLIGSQTLLNQSMIEYYDRLLANQENGLKSFHLEGIELQTVQQIFNIAPLYYNLEEQHENLLTYLIFSILETIKSQILPQSSNEITPTNMDIILRHIHGNIYTPTQLRLNVLADLIHTTPGYISKYFVRNMGCSIRQYIFKYKADLITRKLKSGLFRKKENAAEFGFTDESHLQKFMKRKNIPQ